MAIQLLGADGSSVNAVDPLFKAQRSTMRPVDSLAWNSVAMKSGLITGVVAAAPLMAFRYTGTNQIMLRRLGLGFITTTAFTTAQVVDFQLMVARNFTASDSGGTPYTLPATAYNKHRTSLAAPTGMDLRIATTGALTAGTRTLDAYALSQLAGFSNGAGAGITLAQGNLFEHDTGDYPLILASNEGFEISNITAFGATGVGYLYVDLEFAEISTSVF